MQANVLRSLRPPIGALPLIRTLPLVAVVACTAPAPSIGFSAQGAGARTGDGAPNASSEQARAEVQRGRQLVLGHGCGDCHGGASDPGRDDWLAGKHAEEDVFVLGEYRVWAANLTSDTETGLARYTDRQVFNALRYGLRPAATPDVYITSAVAGTGNHPTRPNYLAPAMPWASYRHLTDEQIRDLIAYLRHVQSVRSETPEAIGPADFWARESSAEFVGAWPVAAFPTENEVPADPALLQKLLQGRALVVSIGCGDCRGGRSDPASPRWLRGLAPAEQRAGAGPFEEEFAIGPITTYARNLTPDNTTGIGRFSERQIFNALRYGLHPGETADIEITSAEPGQGNHPVNPKYLAPPMPWPAWRHLTDAELWSVAAYLKHGLRPARNRVPDSEGPPDFWLEEYTSGTYGPYPAPPFPTARERRPPQGAGVRP